MHIYSKAACRSPFFWDGELEGLLLCIACRKILAACWQEVSQSDIFSDMILNTRPVSEDCFALRLKSGTLNLQKKNFSFIPVMMLLWDCTGNVITAQNNRRLFPMLSANVDDALSTVTAPHMPLMDSKQLVSARLTFSYHNLIILMILLLNLTCILPKGSHGWTRCMNLSWGSENVQGWQYIVMCLSMCVRVSVWAFKFMLLCGAFHRRTQPSSIDHDHTSRHREQEEDYGKLFA